MEHPSWDSSSSQKALRVGSQQLGKMDADAWAERLLSADEADFSLAENFRKPVLHRLPHRARA